MSFSDYVQENLARLIFLGQQHFLLVLYAVGIAALMVIPLALLLDTTGAGSAGMRRRFQFSSREGALLMSSAMLTIPSLGLFALLQPPLGLGVVTSLVGLTIYALYPVLRNTVAGLASVDPAVLEAARGVGMGRMRRLLRLQLPLAWPVILSGLRVSVLITISIAVVAAIVRGPGFGNEVLSGLARLGSAGSFNQVLGGTLGCVVVAALYEIVFAIVRRFTIPRGIRV